MKVTPEQVMRNAGIVSALRKWMTNNNKTIADLNIAMGHAPEYAPGYTYVSGKTTPNHANRQLISKVTGIPIEELMPRNIESVTKPPQLVNNKLSETLHFSVLADGQGRIKLDIVLPAKRAIALLQLIMEGFDNG